MNKGYIDAVNAANFRDSRFAMVFEEDSQVDLGIMREKQNTFKKILKNSEIQRAQSVKLLAKRSFAKQKLENDMKHVTRVIPKVVSLKVKKNTSMIHEVMFNLMFNTKLEITQIVCHWDRINTTGWIPESREGATLIGQENKIYLIGGLGRNILNQVLTLVISKGKWIKNQQFSYKLEPIFSHFCVEYEDSFLIFGGISDYDDLTRKRECFNSVRSLNPKTMEITYIPTRGIIYEFRKYNSCAIIDKYLVVYGGLNVKNGILNTCIVLNLQTKKWREIKTTGCSPGYLAGHSGCSVFSHIKNISLFHESQNDVLIRVQGMYVFGGYDSNYNASDKVYVLQTGKRPLVWTKPDISGIGPSPRYYHSMLYIEKANSLVVFGGRNDQIGACYADVHILRLENLTWIKVIITGSPPAGRSSHSAAMLHNKLYIFGGVSNGKFCKSEMLVLTFNFPQLYKAMAY